MSTITYLSYLCTDSLNYFEELQFEINLNCLCNNVYSETDDNSQFSCIQKSAIFIIILCKIEDKRQSPVLCFFLYAEY